MRRTHPNGGGYGKVERTRTFDPLPARARAAGAHSREAVHVEFSLAVHVSEEEGTKEHVAQGRLVAGAAIGGAAQLRNDRADESI